MKTLRVLFVLGILFGLVGVAVDRRVQRLRRGYEVRRLVEERAHLANEVAWLEGEVLKEALRTKLEERARALGVEIGTRRGRWVVVPPVAPRDGAEDRS